MPGASSATGRSCGALVSRMRSGLRARRVLAVLGKVAAMGLEMRDQRRAPGVARIGVAERVQFQRHAFGDSQLAQQLVRHRQQLDVGLRLVGADDLGVELVELAEAALLRALVAEHRAVGGELQRRMLLPAVGEIGAADAGGEFGPQGQRCPRRGPGRCTSPWRRCRWSRRSSGRRPPSPRTPALRYAGRRRAGARGRTPRPRGGSARPPRRSCPACRGPFAGLCSSSGAVAFLARLGSAGAGWTRLVLRS